MKRIWFGLSLFAFALVAGCGGGGGGSSGTSTGGSGGSAGSSGTAGTAGTAGSTGGSSTGGTGGSTGGSSTGGTGGMGSGGSSTGGTGSGGGSGATCGGFGGVQCAGGEYCDYPDNICGNADGSGTCKPKPQVCSDIVAPVCACDGKVYPNECEAYVAGKDLNKYGGCQAPAGQFPCGYMFCAIGQQYCQVDISDVANMPDTYICKDLPAPCSQPNATCACLANAPCGNMCMQADGGFTVTCPGG